MSEKYTDLTEEIWRTDGGRTSLGSVEMVLDYLDTNPDRVPGRTITASEFDEAVESCVTEDATVPPHTFAARLGVVCVPDPEPTNAEKLEQLHQNWSQSDRNPPFGEWADSVGIQAPEDWGDDD